MALSDDGVIRVDEVLKYTSPGYLWIYVQYIDHGYIDAIESDLMKDVTDRDFYGHLFENTRLVLDYLLRLSENERVIRVYEAAIDHRQEALKSEHSIYINPKKKIETRNASKKWLRHYLPTFRSLVFDYEALLIKLKRTDQDLEIYRSFIRLLKNSLDR